jgi:hypothetical protein
LKKYSTSSLASASLPPLKDAAAEEDLFGDTVTDKLIEVFLCQFCVLMFFFFDKDAVFDVCFVYFVAG